MNNVLEFENTLWNMVQSKKKKHIRQGGIGEIDYENRKQYIRDKVYMLSKEMKCVVTKEDIEHLCEKCFSITTIDKYCIDIYDRYQWTYEI